MTQFIPSQELQKLASTQKIQYVNAEFDDEGIFFYQAYNPKIADYALLHQRFGGPDFGTTRMTWIKPSFGWMLYRCGYSKKHGQERVLKIKLSHQTFAKILAECELTVHTKTSEKTKKADRSQTNQKSSDLPKMACSGRVQWDPERDIYSSEGKQPRKMLRTRAIQIGLAGGLSKFYVKNCISIQDVTPLAIQVGKAHTQKTEADVLEAMKTIANELPNERPYFPCLNSTPELEKLGILPGETADHLYKLGRGKAN